VSIRINVGATFNARDLQRARRELDALGRQAQTTQGKMLRLGDQMKRLGSSMTRVGQTMTRRVSMPLALIGGASIKLAADFETSFGKIQGLVGVAASDIDTLRDAALRLGPQFGRSANEAAEALFFITSAGLRGQSAIDALQSSLKASAAGLGDTATIADLVTSSVNAYGEATLSASAATDVLTNAVRLGKLQPEELAGSMGQVLPIASAMGIRFDEVGAAFAAMSRTGTNASIAATQLRGILSQLLSPTAQSAKALESVGLSAEGIRKQLRERGLLSTLQTLVEAFGDNAAATEAVFGNIRALSGVVDLMGSNVEATTQIFDDMTRSVGVTDQAYNAIADTASQKFAVGLAELKSAGIEIGQTLLPVALDLVQAFRGMVDRFMDLEAPQREALIKFAGIAAIAGPVLMFFGSLITAVAALTVALGAMSVAMIVATGGLVLLGAAIAGIAWKNMTHDSSNAAEALRLEEAAATNAAAGYDKMAEAQRQLARQLRADDREIDRFTQQAANVRQTRAQRIASEEAAAAAAALAAAQTDVAGATNNATQSMGAAGPTVVKLTKGMKELLQSLNETHVGAGDSGDAIAQFSREMLAAGKITDETSAAASRLAQVVRQNIDKALAEGNRRLDEARQKFEQYRDAIAGGISRGNTLTDAVSAQTDAMERLTQAQNAYDEAVRSGDRGRIADATKELKDAQKGERSLLSFLQVGVTTAEGFALQIDSLREAGASLEVVQQIAELGAKTGGRVAAELMAGGAEAIAQANRMVQAVEDASRRAGEGAAQQFFGAGIAAAKSFIAAVEATIPELQSVLDRIADMIAAALGVRPDVNISGGNTFIKPVAGGTTDVVIQNDKGRRTGTPPTPAAPNQIKVPGTFFAAGGLVTGPTLGVVGEAGPELVIPLDRLGGLGGQTVINVTVTSADPQAVVEALRRYTRNNGPLGQVVRV
jgi:TP901 family phage tail tape measure protein